MEVEDPREAQGTEWSRISRRVETTICRLAEVEGGEVHRGPESQEGLKLLNLTTKLRLFSIPESQEGLKHVGSSRPERVPGVVQNLKKG